MYLKKIIVAAITVAIFCPLYNYGCEETRGLLTPTEQQERRELARTVRKKSANYQYQTEPGDQETNGDEVKYPSHVANYAKGLQHDTDGIVVPTSYDSMMTALLSGDPADFDAIVLGGSRKQVNPQAAYACSLEGCDGAINVIPAPPSIASAEGASEMVELYWSALLADVPFNKYDTNKLAQAAATDLSNMSDFTGPKKNGSVTTGTLFRGPFKGELKGPYVSQFLYQSIPFHETKIPQTKKLPLPGTDNDFMTTFNEWRTVQNGGSSGRSIAYTSDVTFLRTARDLGDYVHLDYSYEAFLNAGLILLGYGASALDAGHPYKADLTQAGFATYGGPDLLTLIAVAANAALKAAWYQKWMVHLRLRPEYFGFLVHNQKTSVGSYSLHDDLMSSPVLDNIFDIHGTYFLPQQYPEGSPTHPSYPSGHATIAGACVTILKAYFNEEFAIPSPLQPNTTNTSLELFPGTLLVGHELNKLASNMCIGRNFAGIHYRSDAVQGILLGEAVAISILNDEAFTKNENFAGFSLTKFNGSKITVGAKKIV